MSEAQAQTEKHTLQKRETEKHTGKLLHMAKLHHHKQRKGDLSCLLEQVVQGAPGPWASQRRDRAGL